MSEPTYTTGPYSQPSFIEPLHTEIPPHRAPYILDHAPWMDLYAQISFLGIRMEELVIVSDTRFYTMRNRMDQYWIGLTSQFEYLQQRFERLEDRMDQQQTSFTSQFEHLYQMIEHIEGRLESRHKKMMAYLRFVFPPSPPQP